MNHSVFGRHIYAIGGNLHAAELSGIKTRASTSGCSSTWASSRPSPAWSSPRRLNLAGPKAGDGFELEAISAAFIGGAAVRAASAPSAAPSSVV